VTRKSQLKVWLCYIAKVSPEITESPKLSHSRPIFACPLQKASQLLITAWSCFYSFPSVLNFVFERIYLAGK